MFIKKQCKSLALMVFGLATMFSCNKPEIEPNVVNQPDEHPTVIDGKLEFSTINSFGDFIKNQSKAGNEDFNNARREFDNFISYNEVQHSRQEGNSSSRVSAEAESEDTTYIPDTQLAATLNSKREVIIDKQTYRFGSDYTFVYQPVDTGLITQFYADLNKKMISVPINQLFVYKTKLKVAKTNQGIIRNSLVDSYRTNGSVGSDGYFNDNEKLIGEVWSSSYFFYSSCGAKTYAQRKYRKKFLWWSRDAFEDLSINSISINFAAKTDQTITQKLNGINVSFNITATGFYLYWADTNYNASSVSNTFARMYGFGVSKFVFWDIKSVHSGVQNGVNVSFTVTGSIY